MKKFLILFLILFSKILLAQQIDLTQYFYKKTSNFSEEEKIFNIKSNVAYSSIKPLEIGDKEFFYSYNLENNEYNKIEAILKKIGKYCIVYIEKNKNINKNDLDKIVKEFDENIYLKCQDVFGKLKTNEKITLLLLDIKDGFSKTNKKFVSGYFNAEDCFSKSKIKTSNERKMLYLDIFPNNPNKISFLTTIAHEFQHMIHFEYDSNEFVWLNEGMSQLSSIICGYGFPSQINSFLQNPDNNLISWNEENIIANYGHVSLFAFYLYTHTNKEFIKELIKQKSNGIMSINCILNKLNKQNTFKNIFRAFCIANYLNDIRINNGIYGYKNLYLKIKPNLYIEKFPAKIIDTINYWSCKAFQINIENKNKLKIDFANETIQINGMKNSTDIALLFYSTEKDIIPYVKWLKVENNNLIDEIEINKNYNKLILLIINKFDENLKSENLFNDFSPIKFILNIK